MRRKLWWSLTVVLVAALVVGCGKDEEAPATPPPDGAPPTEGAPPDPGASPPGAPGGPAAPGDPGPPPGVAEPDAAAGAAPPTQVAQAAPPLFPSRPNPFAPLDLPGVYKPPPPPNADLLRQRAARAIPPPPPPPAVTGYTQRNLLHPFRAQIPSVDESVRVPDDTSGIGPENLVTTGIFWGRVVRAVVEQRIPGRDPQNWVVRPGDSITIDFRGPRQMVVVAIDPEGAILRDPGTDRQYRAPFSGR